MSKLTSLRMRTFRAKALVRVHKVSRSIAQVPNVRGSTLDTPVREYGDATRLEQWASATMKSAARHREGTMTVILSRSGTSELVVLCNEALAGVSF